MIHKLWFFTCPETSFGRLILKIQIMNCWGVNIICTFYFLNTISNLAPGTDYDTFLYNWLWTLRSCSLRHWFWIHVINCLVLFSFKYNVLRCRINLKSTFWILPTCIHVAKLKKTKALLNSHLILQGKADWVNANIMHWCMKLNLEIQKLAVAFFDF